MKSCIVQFCITVKVNSELIIDDKSKSPVGKSKNHKSQDETENIDPLPESSMLGGGKPRCMEIQRPCVVEVKEDKNPPAPSGRSNQPVRLPPN